MKIGKIIIAVWVLIISSLTGYAQSGNDAWKDLVVKETGFYKFSVPSSWNEIDMNGLTNPEKYFEVSGKFLPLNYNGKPVIVNIYIVKMEAHNLKEAKGKILEDYGKGADKVFPKGFSHEEKLISLKSGQKAYLVNTRFYRQEKGLNQSRYDLVVYSPKAGSAYLYTMTVQYNDAGYKFDQQYKLKATAEKLYKSFQLKR
jgi:hypothetical protein